MKKITLLILFIIGVGYSQTNNLAGTGVDPNVHLNGSGVMQNRILAPCSFTQPIIAIPNGYSISFTDPGRSVADDFTVPANQTFVPSNFTFVVALTNPVVLNSTNIVFYADNAGLPGALITTLTAQVPVSQNIVGTAFGRNLREVVLNLASSGVSLTGGAAGTKYWVALENGIPSDGADNPFWIAEDIVNGSESAYKASTNGYVWQPGALTFGSPRDMVYSLSGDCSAAPLTYCAASGNSTTYENITNVTYGGINNSTVAPHPGYNDFTAQVANVNRGGTDVISVTIKADGSDYVYAFIDWNQNGILNDAGEVYTLAISTSSNGPHTMSITVPAGAALGDTRMRVKVGWLESTPNPCGTFSFGEVEDYTVNVQAPVVGNPPVIACPTDIVANNDTGVCTAVVNFANAIAFDIEDGVITTTQTGGPASGSAFPLGATTVEFSATDSDGNTVTCEFTVTVIDNENPIAVCQNVTVDLDASGSYTLTPGEIDNGSSDNCGIATLQLGSMGSSTGSLTTTFVGGNSLAGSMFDLEAINNLTIDSFDVNMATGNTADIEVYFKTGTWVGSESNPAAWSLVGTATNITSAGVGLPTPLNLDLGINVAAGDRVAFYVTRTTGSLTYTNGTTVGALFASDSNLQMFEGAGKGYPFGSTFQPRNFNGNIIYSTDGVLMPISGDLDCSNLGTNDIYLIVTDNAGNVSSCLATVTVQDVTAPEIFCLGGSGIFSESEDFEGASIPTGWTTVIETGGYDWSFGSGTMPGGDSFPTNAAIFDDDAAGSGGGANKARLVSPAYDLAGATNVELSFDYSVQDFAGSGTFEAEVWDGTAWQRILFVDNTDQPPINSGIIDVSAYLNAAFQVRFTYDDEGDWAWGAGVDNFLLEYEKAGGGGLDVYLDVNGMATVNPMDLLTGVNEACGYTITTGGGGGGVAGSLTSLFASGNGGSAGGAVYFDITVGPNDLDVTEIDINTAESGTFTMDVYTLVGTSVGNEDDAAAWTLSSTASGTAAGQDIPSNAVLATPITLTANTTYGMALVLDSSHGHRYTNGDGSNENYSNAEMAMALGAASNVPFTPGIFTPRVFNGTIHYVTSGGGSSLDFTCADLGENIIEVTVTDDSGNTATCMAVVNVIDNIAPVIVCQDATIELGPNGTTTVDPYDLILSFVEACGLSTVAVDVPTVTCADIGAPFTVTVFASDASGNIASCTAVITVVDNLAPVITCPADQTVDPGAGNLYYIVPDYFATGEATAIDNCTDPVTVTTQDPAPGAAIPDGVYTVTLTATDEYGNTSTCDFELTVDTIVGVADNSLDTGLMLYPNPAKHVVNLVNKTNISLEKMMIYDINGKLVNQVDLRTMQGERAVDISSLASGVYVVQIIGDNASTVKRLIKE